MNKIEIKFAKQYWRLAIHLIFKTKHFGVNNLWWASQPSAIGWHWYQVVFSILTVMPIVRNYQSLKVRSLLGWISQEDCIKLGYSHSVSP
jgi:hypothetical protein